MEKLPPPLPTFLSALTLHGMPAALQSANAAAAIDLDRSEASGAALAMLERCRSIRLLQAQRRDDRWVVSLALDAGEDSAGSGFDPQVDLIFEIARGDLRRMSAARSWPADIPSAVADFVRAVNASDLDRLSQAFRPGAMINDELTEFWDLDGIRRWADEAISKGQLSIYVARAVLGPNTATLTAYIDGEFDKRGLPDPLVLTLYFTVHEGRIAQLILLRNVEDL